MTMGKYKIKYTEAGEVRTKVYDNCTLHINDQQAGVRTFQVFVYQYFGLAGNHKELVFVCSATTVTRLGMGV